MDRHDLTVDQLNFLRIRAPRAYNHLVQQTISFRQQPSLTPLPIEIPSINNTSHVARNLQTPFRNTSLPTSWDYVSTPSTNILSSPSISHISISSLPPSSASQKPTSDIPTTLLPSPNLDDNARLLENTTNSHSSAPEARTLSSQVSLLRPSSITSSRIAAASASPFVRRRRQRASAASASFVRRRRQRALSSHEILQKLRTEAAFGIHTRFADELYGGLNQRFLTYHSVSESTRKLYLSAFSNFQARVNVNLLHLHNLDRAIADYGYNLHEDDPRPSSRTAVQRLMCYVLIVHPEIHNNLHRTKRIIRAWKAICPTTSATPVSRDIVLAFIGRFMEEDNRDAALYMAICWGGLLRVNEAFALSRSHVSIPGELRSHSQRTEDVGIAIVSSKTGPDQYAFISDTDLVKITSRIVSMLPTNSRLFSKSSQSFNEDLKVVSHFFGFSSHPITSHSNRIGGALHLFLQDVPALDIAIRGRWASTKSLEHYLKNGRNWLSKIHITPEIQAKLSAYISKSLTYATT